MSFFLTMRFISDMDHVCGEGKMPHPVKHCGEADREGCPGGFECRKDFCCPKGILFVLKICSETLYKYS